MMGNHISSWVQIICQRLNNLFLLSQPQTQNVKPFKSTTRKSTTQEPLVYSIYNRRSVVCVCPLQNSHVRPTGPLWSPQGASRRLAPQHAPAGLGQCLVSVFFGSVWLAFLVLVQCLFSVCLEFVYCLFSVCLVFTQCLFSVQFVFGQFLFSVWVLLGQCVVSVCLVFGQCLVSVCLVFVQCLVSVCLVFDQCLVSFCLMFGQCLVNVWLVFVQCLVSVC